jgi:hypothetical protein
MIYRIVSFLIILSMFSCKHDLERTNPLDPNSPYYKPPSIQILAPNGGEEFEVGTSNTISWTSTKVDKVNIELLKNDNIHDVLDSDIENTNSYVWDISSNTNVDIDYKVRVTSANNSEVYDESNSVFTITEDPQPGNITITSPTLNDNWLLGSIKDIVWNITNITGTMSIELLKDGTFLKSIETVTNSPYSWNIDTTNYSSGVNYTIRVVSNSDPSIDAESPIFELTSVPEDTIVILNTVSDSLEIGQNINIEWTTNVTGTVSIWLFQDGEPDLTNPVIETSLPPNSSSYPWYIDAASYSAGVNYTIRVISDNDGSIYDESDPFLMIDPPPQNTYFTFFDDFSDQNIKIYPNINDDISGILPSSFAYINYAEWANSTWPIPEALMGVIFFQTNWPPTVNSNVARVDVENIINNCSSVTGDVATPLKLEMDFNAIVSTFQGVNSLGNYYQNANINCRYGFELYDADNELYVIVYADSYSQELKMQINATQASPGVFISPSEDFGSMGNAPTGFYSPFTSIALEYNGSSFKISSPNSNDINYSVGNQHYTNINFETIGFYFYLDYALNDSPDTQTYFDNVSLEGLKVPAKKGKKKNASFFKIK